jgi:malate dehydrogenase
MLRNAVILPRFGARAAVSSQRSFSTAQAKFDTDIAALLKSSSFSSDSDASLLEFSKAGNDLVSARYGDANTAKYFRAPVHVAITGASGAVGSSLLGRLASGQMLGPDQPVVLHCIELPGKMANLKKLTKKLQSANFPLLKDVVLTGDLAEGFDKVKYAILLGAKAQAPGMKRIDLLKDNSAIFAAQGKALSAVAHPKVRVLVVGNPANTNALICAHNAPKLSSDQFSSLMRLDQDRATLELAKKAGVAPETVDRVAAWGNNSESVFTDVFNARVGGQRALGLGPVDAKFAESLATLATTESAASAASAACISHMRDWALGSTGFSSMGVMSNGAYGFDENLFVGMPTICSGGNANAILDIPVTPFAAERMERCRKELLEEREMVKDLLK